MVQLGFAAQVMESDAGVVAFTSHLTLEGVSSLKGTQTQAVLGRPTCCGWGSPAGEHTILEGSHARHDDIFQYTLKSRFVVRWEELTWERCATGGWGAARLDDSMAAAPIVIGHSEG